MDFSLQLVNSGQSEHRAAGILIPGDNTTQWLEQAASWNMPVSGLRFLPVSEAAAGIAGDAERPVTIGALCVSVSGPLSESATRSLEGLPFWCRANRLWLPVGGDLTPAITDTELRQLLSPERHYVWRPASGLVGYDPEHVLSVTDLLRRPQIRESAWTAAESTEPLHHTLHQLRPEPTDSSADILDLGRDDIGSSAKQLENFPGSPHQSPVGAVRDAAAAAFDGLNAALAKMIYGLTSRLPNSESGSPALTRLHAWAESVLRGNGSDSSHGRDRKAGSRRDRNLARKREQEIQRLVNLLDQDPEQGLRYAVPLGGEDRSRGRSDPQSRLARHDDEFNLNLLRGSSRADVWELPWEYRAKLEARYRELALREQRLGRHRRAAYIYAQLLHDVPAAAGILEAGHLYRDAAAVYLEHLNNPLKAAECLRAGGYWEEAVQIYQNREQWLDAGTLFQEMGRYEESRNMFTNQIRDCERRRDFTSAADVANQRLDDPDQATELLIAGWTHPANGLACFRQLMSLNAARSRHRNTLVTMQQLSTDDSLQLDQIQDAVRVCSETAGAYPDESVRQAARHHTFRLAARLLNSSANVADLRATALEAVRSLAAADRLLHTDTQRYEFQQQLQSEASFTPTGRPSGTLRGVRQSTSSGLALASVPPGTRWLDIVNSGSCVYRLGLTVDDRLVLVRQLMAARRDGRLVSSDAVIVLADPLEVPTDSLRLLFQPGMSSVLLLSCPNDTPWNQSIRNTQRILDSDFVEIIVLGLKSVSSVTAGPGGLYCLSLVEDASGLTIRMNILSRPDRLENTIVIESSKELKSGLHEPGAFRSLHVASYAYMTIGRMLLRTVLPVTETLRSFPRPVALRPFEEFPLAPLRMIASRDQKSPCLVYSFAEGVRAVWPADGQSCALAGDLVKPMTAFTGNGILAVACSESDRLEFYRLQDCKAEQIAGVNNAQTGPQRQIQFLTCGLSANQILAFCANGRVEQFEIPVR